MDQMNKRDRVSAARHLGELWQDQNAPFVSLSSEVLLSSTPIATRQSVEGPVGKRQRVFAVQTGGLSILLVIIRKARKTRVTQNSVPKTSQHIANYSSHTRCTTSMT